MKVTSDIRNRKQDALFMLAGIPLSLVFAHFILYSLDPDSIWWDWYEKIQLIEIVVSILTGVLIYAAILGIVRYLSYWIDRKALFNNNLLIIFVVTTFVVVISMLLLLYLEDLFFSWYCPSDVEPTLEMEKAFRSYIIVNMIVAAFVNSFFNTYNFFEKWKVEVTESNKLAILSHELKQTALQAELEVLKLQLDPHFLFNNFSILTQLIQTNKDDALLFLANLSRVYRYILVNKRAHIITLDEELKFVYNYFHLIKIRQGESIHLEVNLAEDDKKKGVPPVTLQLLIENAIKHNISTIKQPLVIHIESRGDGYIVVRNNLQRINIDYKGTGLGLANVKERYHLIGGTAPEIIETENEFQVRLPLLNF